MVKIKRDVRSRLVPLNVEVDGEEVPKKKKCFGLGSPETWREIEVII